MQRLPILTKGSLKQAFVSQSDGAGGHESYVRSEQDCTRIADDNKRLSADFRGTTKNGTAIAARVPVIYRYVKWPLEFQIRHGVHPDRPPADMSQADRVRVSEKWAKFYREKLNHPDFRAFRTDGGRRL